MKIRITKGTVRIGHPPHTEDLRKGTIRVVPDEVGDEIIAKGVGERVTTKTKVGLDAGKLNGGDAA